MYHLDPPPLNLFQSKNRGICEKKFWKKFTKNWVFYYVNNIISGGCILPFLKVYVYILTMKTLEERKQEWKDQCSEIHDNKYDYSKVGYVNYKTPVIIICPDHGEFTMRPINHQQGKGCRLCNRKNKTSTKKKVSVVNDVDEKIIYQTMVVYKCEFSDGCYYYGITHNLKKDKGVIYDHSQKLNEKPIFKLLTNEPISTKQAVMIEKELIDKSY